LSMREAEMTAASGAGGRGGGRGSRVSRVSMQCCDLRKVPEASSSWRSALISSRVSGQQSRSLFTLDTFSLMSYSIQL
jgi:hypothetical protein